MRAITTRGHEIDICDPTIARLRTRLRGPVLLPGDASYEEARAVWNAMIDRRPAIIARCLDTADVLAVVQFSRERDLLVSIKGGGHNTAGLAVADGAVMLDLSGMRAVAVDVQRKIAQVQPGCLLGDVDHETQLHGLAAVLGFVSFTGVAGVTVGGGFGFLTRRWGWTADNVVSFDVVTADGRLVRASDDENPDLLWGLRGGGGNFGVVTGIEYLLHDVGPDVVGGIVAWPAAEAPAILEFYRTLTEAAPPELTLVAFIGPAPAAAWLPADVCGTPIVAILACYSGRLDKGKEAVGPIKSFRRPIGDAMIRRRPYVQMQSLLDSTQPQGRRYYWKSEYLSEIPPALCDAVIEQALRISSPHSAVLLFHVAGALNRLPPEHSAVGNRDAHYVLNVAGSWERPADDDANIEWVRTAWNETRAFSTRGTHINFLTQDEGPERVAAALGSDLKRLGQIKAKWDPENTFRTNRNVAPAVSA